MATDVAARGLDIKSNLAEILKRIISTLDSLSPGAGGTGLLCLRNFRRPDASQRVNSKTSHRMMSYAHSQVFGG